MRLIADGLERDLKSFDRLAENALTAVEEYKAVLNGGQPSNNIASSRKGRSN